MKCLLLPCQKRARRQFNTLIGACGGEHDSFHHFTVLLLSRPIWLLFFICDDAVQRRQRRGAHMDRRRLRVVAPCVGSGGHVAQRLRLTCGMHGAVHLVAQDTGLLSVLSDELIKRRLVAGVEFFRSSNRRHHFLQWRRPHRLCIRSVSLG